MRLRHRRVKPGLEHLMPSATLNLRLEPRRMLSAREAAGYVGIPVSRFTLLCSVPPIQLPSGGRLYDMRDLDMWIDTLKGGGMESDSDILGRLD